MTLETSETSETQTQVIQLTFYSVIIQFEHVDYSYLSKSSAARGHHCLVYHTGGEGALTVVTPDKGGTTRTRTILRELDI